MQIRKLAVELGLHAATDPVRAILSACEEQVRAVLREFPHCVTPAQLLEALANKLGTIFEVVRSDVDLRRLQARYLAQGEVGFSRLNEELDDQTYGITIRRVQRKLWEPEFVSVIDCRGEKSYRQNHTKWHELGHLLILTDDTRAAFRRTHCSEAELKDPEEALVDIIAGNFAFFPEMVQGHIQGPASFEAIEQLRMKLSPEASRQSAMIGIVKAWPTPCLFIHAELALRKSERRGLQQGAFPFEEVPQPVLRATHVTQSQGAREVGFTIFPNMRVPAQSIIYSVFLEGSGECEAVEDLSMWESSDGTRLKAQTVLVKAKYAWNAVQALIVPEDE